MLSHRYLNHSCFIRLLLIFLLGSVYPCMCVWRYAHVLTWALCGGERYILDFVFDCSTPSFLRQFLTEPRAIWSTPLAGHWALGTQSLQLCTMVAGVVLAWLFYMDAGDNLDPQFCVTCTVYVSHSLCSWILVLSSCLTVYVSLTWTLLFRSKRPWSLRNSSASASHIGIAVMWYF